MPLLLLLTLTQFPGGIAQQQGALLQWLGGGPFKSDPDATFPHREEASVPDRD